VVPLSPDWPTDRLATMLADCTLTALVLRAMS
jgi:hypothetical protein